MCFSVHESENLIYDNQKSHLMTDFFKGIAIFMVLLTHSHQMFEIPSLLFDVFNFLQLGCQIFFVLSAFGLCFLYEKKKVSWFSFMRDRISRFAIGYWMMILFFIIYQTVSAIVSGTDILTNINFPGVIINLLFLNGLAPIDYINNHIVSGGWFMGTLVILYALFPLLYRLYGLRYEKWRKVRIVAFPVVMFVLSVTIINLAGMINPAFGIQNPIIYRLFINQLPCFVMGFSLYDLYKNKKIVNVKFPLLFSLLFLFSSIVLFYLEFIWVVFLYHVLFSGAFVFLYIFVCQRNSVFCFCTSETNGIVNFIRKNGRISFFIYMVQSIVMFYMTKPFLAFIRNYCANELVVYLLILPVMIILCLISGKVLYAIDRDIRRLITGKKSD